MSLLCLPVARLGVQLQLKYVPARNNKREDGLVDVAQHVRAVRFYVPVRKCVPWEHLLCSLLAPDALPCPCLHPRENLTKKTTIMHT